jgi:hypothetical protein
VKHSARTSLTQSEVIGKQVTVHFWDIPAGEVGVDTVHQRRVVTHLRRQRTEQVTNSLLVLHVNVEIPKQDDAGADAIAAVGEFARLPESFHDVDAVLLVEGDARYLIEADHVVLTSR